MDWEFIFGFELFCFVVELFPTYPRQVLRFLVGIGDFKFSVNQR